MAIRGEVGSEEDSFLSSPSCPLGGETAPLFTDKTDRQTDRQTHKLLGQKMVQLYKAS